MNRDYPLAPTSAPQPISDSLMNESNRKKALANKLENSGIKNVVIGGKTTSNAKKTLEIAKEKLGVAGSELAKLLRIEATKDSINSVKRKK